MNEKLNELIASKEAELTELQTYLGVLRDIQGRPDSDAYLNVLLDVRAALSRGVDSPAEAPNGVRTGLQSGSEVSAALSAIKTAGQPLHISDILIELDLPRTGKKASSVSSQLNYYARRGRFFKRVAANTFDVLGE